MALLELYTKNTSLYVQLILPIQWYQSFEASVTILKETLKHEFGHSSQPYTMHILFVTFSAPKQGDYRGNIRRFATQRCVELL